MPQDTGNNASYIDLSYININTVFGNVVEIVFSKKLKFIFV
jgi:hypothetical protein